MTTVYGQPVASRQCDLCGVTSPDVHVSLACFADDGRFERIDRCSDHQACRDRLEAQGKWWPLVDLTRPNGEAATEAAASATGAPRLDASALSLPSEHTS